MKKFKLVYWSDCRGMEINSVEVVELKNGRKVLEYLIGKKVDDESWVDYVNDLLNLGSSDIDWVEDKSKWVDMFVIGDINKEVFEVDFCNELNSCLIVREDSEYFNREFDLDLLEEVENKYGI